MATTVDSRRETVSLIGSDKVESSAARFQSSDRQHHIPVLKGRP